MSSDLAIAVAARDAGFSGSDLITAVAIVWAESGGNENATNFNKDGTTDYGLWQINSVHGDLLAHGNWRDPKSNAKMAFSLYVARGHKFKDWMAYNANKHLLYMPRATAAVALTGGVAGPIPGAIGEAQTGSVDSLPGVKEITDFIKFVSDKNNWVRLGYIVTGGILLLFAFISVIKSSPVGDSVETAAKIAMVVK